MEQSKSRNSRSEVRNLGGDVVPDTSERFLRGMAVGLGVLLLLGAAACGDDAGRTGATVTQAAEVDAPTTLTPEVDRGSSPGLAMSAVDTAQPTEMEVPSVATTARSVEGLSSYGVAEAAYQDRRYAEAVDLFEDYVDSRPDNPWGYYMLGLSAWKAGHLDIAEANLRESVTRAPYHGKSHVNLARVLLESGQTEAGLEHAVIAEDIDPESVQAKRVLARALGESGQINEAIEAYEGVLWLDDEDTWSLNNMGYLLIQKGRFAEAVGPLSLAVTLAEENPTFGNNLAHALEGAGYTRAAMAVLQGVVEEDPAHEKATATLARLDAVVVGPEPSFDIGLAAEDFRVRFMGVLAVKEMTLPEDSIPETR